MRAFLSSAIVVLLAAGVAISAALADDQRGTVKVTVLGPDGHPAPGTTVRTSPWAEEGQAPQIKGRVLRVSARDEKGNEADTTVYVPDGKEVPVKLELKPQATGSSGAYKAEQAAKNGDLDAYNEGVTEANAGVQREEKLAEDTQAAIDAWAKDNDIPVSNLKTINRQLKAAEASGSNADPAAVENLKSYKIKLEYLEKYKEQITKTKKRVAALKPPEKKAVMLPSTCPEGQSGGLLAGLINSATGSNTVQGICGEEAEKDNKDHRPDDHHEHDD